MFGWISFLRTKKPTLAEQLLTLSDEDFADYVGKMFASEIVITSHSIMTLVASWHQEIVANVASKISGHQLRSTADWIRFHGEMVLKSRGKEIAFRRCHWFFCAALIKHLESLATSNEKCQDSLKKVWSRFLMDSIWAHETLQSNIIWSDDEKAIFIVNNPNEKFQKYQCLIAAKEMIPDTIKQSSEIKSAFDRAKLEIEIPGILDNEDED